jgi:nicotinate phosphoribosyltransferase
MVGGTRLVSTDANARFWKGKGIGTIPHSLIAAYEGNTVEACEAFKRHQPKNIDLISLVDFQNDCVKTSLEVARRFQKELWGVRLDTAGDLIDRSVKEEGSEFLGVCPELVWNVRQALNREGFTGVKIVISGGFDAEKIRKFVELDVPFDAVGVGSAFYKRRIDFTADIVMVEKQYCAKVGRQYNQNPRLEEV